MTTVKCDDSAPVNAALGQQHCLISVIAGESIFVSGIVGPDILATHWRWAVYPGARQARLRPRRRKHPSKRNATARAVEGNLGGFCVSGSRLVTQWTTCADQGLMSE